MRGIAYLLGTLIFCVAGCAGDTFRTVVPIQAPANGELMGRVQSSMLPTWMRPAIGPIDGYTYIGEFYSSSLNLYRTNNKKDHPPACHISPVYSPQGMKTDHNGVLFTTYEYNVENRGVQTFAPNCGRAGRKFLDPVGIADDLAIDDKVLYVSDLISIGEKAATIELYTLNDSDEMAAYPIGDLHDPSTQKGIGVVVDSQHNVFWATTTMNWSVGRVVEYAKGKMPGIVLTAMSIGNDFPGGLVIDHNDNLALIDQTHPSVSVYAPPYTSKAFSSFPLNGTAVYCALGDRDRRIYCLDYQFGSVDAYTFPSGRYLFSYTNGIEHSEAPEGIAIEEPPGS